MEHTYNEVLVNTIICRGQWLCCQKIAMLSSMASSAAVPQKSRCVTRVSMVHVCPLLCVLHPGTNEGN